jgi:outer membrane protein assembly factor BamB
VDSSPAIGADGAVYVASQDGKLYALDGLTGGKRWSYPLLPYGDSTNSPAIGADGTVYAAAASGPLIAVRAHAFIANDAAAALRFAGGMLISSAGSNHWNVEKNGTSTGTVDVLDAVRLARMAAHLDPNP